MHEKKIMMSLEIHDYAYFSGIKMHNFLNMHDMKTEWKRLKCKTWVYNEVKIHKIHDVCRVINTQESEIIGW